MSLFLKGPDPNLWVIAHCWQIGIRCRKAGWRGFPAVNPEQVMGHIRVTWTG